MNFEIVSAYWDSCFKPCQSAEAMGQVGGPQRGRFNEFWNCITRRRPWGRWVGCKNANIVIFHKISLFTNLLKILEFLFEAMSVGGGHGAGGWAANIFKLCGRLNEFWWRGPWGRWIRQNQWNFIKIHEILQFPYTVEDQKKHILNKIKVQKKLAFSELIYDNPLKILVIYNFLAILDLIHNSVISVSLGDGLNNFWISLN